MPRDRIELPTRGFSAHNTANEDNELQIVGASTVAILQEQPTLVVALDDDLAALSTRAMSETEWQLPDVISGVLEVGLKTLLTSGEVSPSR